MHAEKGLNNVKGFRVYYDFWEYIRTKAAEVDCGTQKSGFEGTESFKRNYREGCSVCYMRTEKSGLPVNGAIKLGTLANNTFYISNGN